jgi:hypothetical protein
MIQLAKALGYRVAHFRPGRTAAGWRTAVQGDGAGFVDLVLGRERVVFAELKTDRGRLTAQQAAWVRALQAAGQEVHVWRPSQWDAIVEVLR